MISKLCSISFPGGNKVTEPSRAPTKAGPIGAAAIIAAACLAIAPFTSQREGYVSKARPDPAGIMTYCNGETEHVDPVRIYSRDDCDTLLRRRLARDYAPKVLACVPALAEPRRRPAFEAMIDASYNAGPKALCGSSIARLARAGQWRAACDRFLGWRDTARNRKTGIVRRYPGLVSRRAAERALCLKGA